MFWESRYLPKFVYCTDQKSTTDGVDYSNLGHSWQEQGYITNCLEMLHMGRGILKKDHSDVATCINQGVGSS